MLEALRLARAELDGRVPLIGFAGAPWTLMSYMVEGAGTKTVHPGEALSGGAAQRVRTRCSAGWPTTVGRFLVAQVAAGAQAVQLFDSWAGALGPRDFREFALPYLAEAVRAARNAGVPVIVFAPGAGWALEEIATATGADVIGVDWQTDAGRRAAQARDHAGGAAGQPGSLPGCTRRRPRSSARTHAMLEAFGGAGHIANLGHGILPDVPVDARAAFVRRGAGVAAPVSERLRSRRCRRGSIAALHDDATRFFSELDGGRALREDRWERPGGGGGVTRVLTDGEAFEKGGVNRSVVEGVMPAADGARGWAHARRATCEPHSSWPGSASWSIRGSPKVPTVHLNVRYFEITRRRRRAASTPGSAAGPTSRPTYPHAEDAIHFHRTLKAICRPAPPFVLSAVQDLVRQLLRQPSPGRGAPRRGRHLLRPPARGRQRARSRGSSSRSWRTWDACCRRRTGRSSGGAKDEAYGERERRFQLVRRGRYVEFNLVHDRGTLFGLQTNARIESVLMSLPPLAAWEYAPVYEPGSFEAELLAMLEPRDWANASSTD